MKKELDMKKKESDINRCIGQRVQDARVAAGYARETLARKIGVSENQLVKYENGTDNNSTAKLLLICEALSLNANYFLEGVKQVEWDKKTSESQIAALNLSNNFMKIKDKTC